jgi:hypothetical protein
LLIALLPVTLAWKIVAPTDMKSEAKEPMIEFLSRYRFEVEVTDQNVLEGMPLIHARAGSCQMHIIEASPDGWNRELVQDLARSSDDLFIVFGGRTYHEYPTWRAVTHRLWSKYLRKLGVPVNAMPVLVVAATASCDAENLPWAELY